MIRPAEPGGGGEDEVERETRTSAPPGERAAPSRARPVEPSRAHVPKLARGSTACCRPNGEGDHQDGRGVAWLSGPSDSVQPASLGRRHIRRPTQRHTDGAHAAPADVSPRAQTDGVSRPDPEPWGRHEASSAGSGGTDGSAPGPTTSAATLAWAAHGATSGRRSESWTASPATPVLARTVGAMLLTSSTVPAATEAAGGRSQCRVSWSRSPP